MTVVTFDSTDIARVDEAEIFRDVFGHDHTVWYRRICEWCGDTIAIICDDGYVGTYNRLHCDCPA